MGCAWSEHGPTLSQLWTLVGTSGGLCCAISPRLGVLSSWRFKMVRTTSFSFSCHGLPCSCWCPGCSWFLLAVFFLPWALGPWINTECWGPAAHRSPCCWCPKAMWKHQAVVQFVTGGSRPKQSLFQGLWPRYFTVLGSACSRWQGTIREHTSSVPVLMGFYISPSIKGSIKAVQKFAPSFTNSLWPYIFGDGKSLNSILNLNLKLLVFCITEDKKDLIEVKTDVSYPLPFFLLF